MKTKFTILIVIIAICFSSCATILGGSSKGVHVNQGTPNNAKVFYNGEYIGNAPCKVQIQKSFRPGNSQIVIKADGYQTETIQMTRKVSVGYTLLDICTGVVWVFIDFGTGNIYKPRPRIIDYYLEKNQDSNINSNNNSMTNTTPSDSINHYDQNKSPNVDTSTDFKIGDNVKMTNPYGKEVIGKIIEINGNTALVEYTSSLGRTYQVERNFSKITKVK